MRRKAPAPPTMQPFAPLSEYRCRRCDGPVGAEGTVCVTRGAEAWAYCGPTCASRAGLWPWADAKIPAAPVPLVDVRKAMLAEEAASCESG